MILCLQSLILATGYVRAKISMQWKIFKQTVVIGCRYCQKELWVCCEWVISWSHASVHWKHHGKTNVILIDQSGLVLCLEIMHWKYDLSECCACVTFRWLRCWTRAKVWGPQGSLLMFWERKSREKMLFAFIYCKLLLSLFPLTWTTNHALLQRPVATLKLNFC